MTAHEVAAFITHYARLQSAPVHSHTTVRSVSADPTGETGFRVVTDRQTWRCRAVLLASGACATAVVPAIASQVPAGVTQWTAATYRRPAQLADGRVLVVGASATGVQLAQEIQRSGRPVTLAVGDHVRLPRVYRGRDIQWWLHATGVLDRRLEDAQDPQQARRVPSPQLIGSSGRETLDLNALQEIGVEVVGRLAGIREGKALFSGGLRNVCARADQKLERLLETIDAWVQQNGLDADVGPVQRHRPIELPARSRLERNLGGDVRSVVWATGFRPEHSWLDLPVFEHGGQLRHDRGVIAAGLYVLGLPFLRRRKSSFIHGAEDDARELVNHLVQHLERASPAPGRQKMCRMPS